MVSDSKDSTPWNSESKSPLSSLQGIPFGVKNNIAVLGLKMQAGSPAMPDEPATKNAEVVTNILGAGAFCAGTQNMHELALGTTSANAFFGVTKNPVDLLRMAGGSSGGSAASVADGSVPFSLGTDTGGSCRIPAAYCGVVGFRPSSGRYSSDGVFVISPTRDTVGILARNVSDVALVDAAIMREQNQRIQVKKNLRIGIPRIGFFDELSTEVESNFAQTLNLLEDSGIEFIEVEVSGSHDGAAHGLSVVAFETPRQVLKFFGFEASNEPLTSDHTDFLMNFMEGISSPDVRGAFEHFLMSPVDRQTYEAALDYRRNLQAAYAETFADADVAAITYPTVGIVAPPLNSETISLNGETKNLFAYSIRNTDPGSLAGQPALTIPIYRSDGALPIGLSLEGPVGSDRKLLSIGLHFENFLTSS
jgi:mandelamide amidase